MSKSLSVYIADVKAGTAFADSSGGIHFSYDEAYEGIPLSLSMPISSETYGDKVVRPFLQGLLPDSRDTRRAVARRFGVSSENPLALLEHIGLDCPGAVQLCSPDNEGTIVRKEVLVPLFEEDIARRLEAIGNRRRALVARRRPRENRPPL